MITNSGLWRIENETRYNTEDLVAIFNVYEDALTALMEDQGQPLRSACDGLGVIRFRDYSPVVRSVKIARTTAEGSVCSSERVFVRRPPWGCNNEKVAGLVKPSMLFDSPLEALAHSASGDQAPKGFSMAVIRDVIRDCYHGFIGWDAMKGIPDIPVRIQARRASKPSGAPVKGLVLRQVRESLVPASHSIGTMRWRVESVKAHLEEAQRKGDTIGLKLDTTVEVIEDLRARLEAVYLMLQNDFTNTNRAGG
jgi:hypothetical protein